jgi:hypothetical protein
MSIITRVLSSRNQLSPHYLSIIASSSHLVEVSTRCFYKRLTDLLSTILLSTICCNAVQTTSYFYWIDSSAMLPYKESLWSRCRHCMLAADHASSCIFDLGYSLSPSTIGCPPLGGYLFYFVFYFILPLLGDLVGIFCRMPAWISTQVVSTMALAISFLHQFHIIWWFRSPWQKFFFVLYNPSSSGHFIHHLHRHHANIWPVLHLMCKKYTWRK